VTTIVTGVVPTRNENPNLKWEQTAQYNVAAEFGFKDNKYTGYPRVLPQEHP
jgi:hypothetical protein